MEIVSSFDIRYSNLSPMSFPLLIAIATAALFGLLAIYFSLKEEKTRKALKDQTEDDKRALYKIAILKEIQGRIGYELDTEKVADVIIGSLSSLFPYSTASSLLLKEGKLVFKTNVQESVNEEFLKQVKQSMMASFSALVTPLPEQIGEIVQGAPLTETGTSVASFFHIPFVVSDEVVGILNISSTKPNLYKESEMTILYQITDLASKALSKLEHVLTTEKGKLMSLIGSLTDGVFMLDTQNNLLVINDAARRMLRIEKRQPTALDAFSVLTGSFNIVSKLEETVQKKTTIEEKEVSLGERSVRVVITPVLDASKTLLGTSVLLQDITLEKNLERLKEDFTNMIIHELRAPLSAIKGASKLLMQQTGLEQSDQNKMVAIIHEQSQKLLEQVNTLLDAAKLEAGHFVIQRMPESLEKIIQDAMVVFDSTAKAKNIELTYKAYAQVPKFSFDAVRMSQVMNNLLSNSLKFTPSGGKITVSLEAITEKGLPFFRVSVADTGMGIPKDKQDKLFSKFYQAQGNQPGAEHQVGTGLGLFISKGIVEAHGGAISLVSEEGHGTTIAFTLPVEEPVQTQPEPKLIAYPSYLTKQASPSLN